MTDAELKEARIKCVAEIEDLNSRIEYEKSNRHKAKRHQLERQRGYKYELLRNFDAELKRRNLTHG